MPSSRESLADMVLSYLEDPEVALWPDDPTKEVRANTCAYSVQEVEIDVPEVVRALAHVAAELRKRLSDQSGPATFYAWYDEQAGQLRCSLSSALPNRLPFGGKYESSSEQVTAEQVARLAADDPHPGVIPWDELHDVSASEDWIEVEPRSFPVWAVLVR